MSKPADLKRYTQFYVLRFHGALVRSLEMVGSLGSVANGGRLSRNVFVCTCAGTAMGHATLSWAPLV